MKIYCPECETENEIEFVDPSSESQSVECVGCKVQFVATKDGSSETQAVLQNMSEGETLTADVGEVSDSGQEQETFEEEAGSIDSSFDPDNIENMLDQMLEDDAPEVFAGLVEDAETSPHETGDDVIDKNISDSELEIEDAPESVAGQTEITDTISTSPGGDDIENILDGMLTDTSFGGLDSDVEDAPEVITDQVEDAETISAPPGGDDLDSILDGMLNSDVGVEDVLESEIEDAPEVVVYPNEEEVEEVSDPPSQEDLDNVLEGMLNNDTGRGDIGTQVEKTPEVLENNPPKKIESEQPVEVAAEPLSEKTTETDQNSDMKTISPDASEKVDSVNEDIEEPEETEESEEDILSSLKEEMGLDDLFSDDEDDLDESKSKPDEKIDEQTAVEPKNAIEESELPTSASELTKDELPPVEAKNENSDEIVSPEDYSEGSNVQDNIERMLEENIQEDAEITQETKQELKEENTVIEEKLDEIWDDTVNSSNEVTEESKENSKTNSEDHTVAEEKPEESEDDLWSQAFAEQDDLNKEQEVSKTEKDSGADGGEEDLLAQAFAEQDELNKEKEPESVEAVDDVVETTEEDHSQTAPEEDEAAMAIAEDVEEAPEEGEDASGGIKEEDYEDEDDEGEADTEDEEEPEAGDIREEDYEDEEDYEEEDEPRRKIGPIPIPSSTLGKALMGASLAAVLITAGGFYFGIQTFMPEEVAKYIPFLKKEVPAEEDIASKEEGTSEAGKEAGPNQTEDANPDALNLAMEGEDSSEPPKEAMAQKAESGEMTAETSSEAESAPEKPAQEEQTEAASSSDGTTPANQDPQANAMQKEQPTPAETDKPKEKEKPLILGSEEKVSEEAKDVTKALQAALGDKGETSVDPDSGLLAALSPTEKTIMFGTIMPVAYNINDIRVLSFDLQVELDNGKTAKLIREALPVYEKIMIDTVEKFLEKKFYNDILYVKEKLQKQLQKNFNKSIRGGRVKKAKFKEFTIQ
jgi:hypothetical protein